MVATVISATQWTSGNVTVPSDCTAAYLFWVAGYSTGYSITAAANATLGGNSANSYSVASPSEAGYITGGLVIWYNPPTGSRALSITFNATPDTTGYIIVFVKDGDTNNYRDADANFGLNSQSVTIDSNTTDLVIKAANLYSGAVPPAGTGWTSIAVIDDDETNMRVSRADSPGASTTTASTGTTGDLTTIVAVSIMEGASAATALPRRAIDGPFYGSLRGSVR